MANMDERTKRIIAIGAAGVAAAGAAGVAAYMNAEELFAIGIRMTFKKNDDKRDRGLTAPDDVVRVTDLAYGTDPEQVLDIYYPVGTGEALPTIVSVHGGAYVYGDKNLYQFYCMSLAQKGFAVVNFSYRLAPGHKFPDQLNDINSVMKFVCAVAEEYYIDLGNVFFVGDSAGAQMASQYLTAVTNPEYAELLGLDIPAKPGTESSAEPGAESSVEPGTEIPAFTVRAAALNCGMYKLDPVREKMLIRCYLGSEEVAWSEKMDVLGHMTGAFPPCFIMTATGDFLRVNAKPLGRHLGSLGVENEVHVYGEETKPLGHVFHCDVRNPYAKVCNEEECEFFRRHAVRS